MRPFLLLLTLLVLSSCGGPEVPDRLHFDVPEVSALTVGCGYKHMVDLSREAFEEEVLLVTTSNGNIELNRGFGARTKTILIPPGQDNAAVWIYGLEPGSTIVTFHLLGCCSKNLVVNVFPEPPAE